MRICKTDGCTDEETESTANIEVSRCSFCPVHCEITVLCGSEISLCYIFPALFVHSRFGLQADSVPAGDDSPFADTVTLEQKTSSISGTSGKVSLWMQWMLPKVIVKLFAPDPTAKKAGTRSSQWLIFLK